MQRMQNLDYQIGLLPGIPHNQSDFIFERWIGLARCADNTD
jgi:hypothetical protein